ncbi:MAG: hypothetical protein A2Z14_17165 [Chloroflexi bacterium RBG_16_48_8]|nr:MAG: hypothetical protein A2Z14_17165 [Chloroflexi bacterium RBG_16_48_8]
MTFFSTLAFSAMPATFALYAERVLFTQSVPPDQIQFAIGLMLTLYGLMTVITQVGFLRPLGQRLGERGLVPSQYGIDGLYLNQAIIYTFQSI